MREIRPSSPVLRAAKAAQESHIRDRYARCSGPRYNMVTGLPYPALEPFRKAASRGDTEFLRSQRAALAAMDPSDRVAVFQAAAAAGSIDAMEWLYANKFEWNEDVCAVAARYNRGAALRWLRDHGCPWSGTTGCMAARGGHVAILEQAALAGCHFWCPITCEAAAAAGQLGALRWLRAHGCPWDSGTAHAALKEGHTAVYEWAIAHGCPKPPGLMFTGDEPPLMPDGAPPDWTPEYVGDWAPSYGGALSSGDVWPRRALAGVPDMSDSDDDVPSIHWDSPLHRGRAPFSAPPPLSLVRRDSSSGDDSSDGEPDEGDEGDDGDDGGQAPQRYAAPTDGEPTGELAEWVANARAGRLGALRAAWASQRAPLWDTWMRTMPSMVALVFRAAARSGSRETLNWLYANGFPWNEDACAAAAKGGHALALVLLHSLGCPWDGITACMAAKKGHIHVLEWLERAGYDHWSVDTCAWAAQEGRLDALRWLRGRGHPWDVNTVLAARRHPETLAWAIAQGCPTSLRGPAR